MSVKEIDEIKEQFKKVISYSQGIENPVVDDLFEKWLEGKRDFIEAMGGKLIYEFPKKVFFELIHKAFAQRRKKMVNSLTSTNFNNMDKQSIEKLFSDCDIKLTARAEELDIEDFIKLANSIE